MRARSAGVLGLALTGALLCAGLGGCAVRRIHKERDVPWVFSREKHSDGWLMFHAGYQEGWSKGGKVLFWLGPGH